MTHEEEFEEWWNTSAYEGKRKQDKSALWLGFCYGIKVERQKGEEERAELKSKLLHEFAKNFQYEAEKATPGYLLNKVEKLEEDGERLREALQNVLKISINMTDLIKALEPK